MRPTDAPGPAIDEEEADVALLQDRRDRLRDAVARAEAERAGLEQYRASAEKDGSQSRTRRLPRWLPPALRFFVGAAAGAGLAFLLAYTIIYGAFH